MNRNSFFQKNYSQLSFSHLLTRNILFFFLPLLCLLTNNLSSTAQQVLSLYHDSIPNSVRSIGKEDGPKMTIYLSPKEIATGTAVIIFPGGAYEFLATHSEGTLVAREFVKKGISAFVVKYRLPSEIIMRDKSMGPLMDAQQAIKNVRTRAKEWDIDSNKIGIIGYSAGGHLASTLGTHFTTSYISNTENTSLRPDFMILVYPVISMDNPLTHRGSRINLLGNGPSLDKVRFFSNEEQVTNKTPPTYLTHTQDDEIVSVENSIVFYEACLKNNVPVEMHLYPKGNHGFTQKLPLSEWLNPMLSFLKRENMYKEVPNEKKAE